MWQKERKQRLLRKSIYVLLSLPVQAEDVLERRHEGAQGGKNEADSVRTSMILIARSGGTRNGRPKGHVLINVKYRSLARLLLLAYEGFREFRLP